MTPAALAGAVRRLPTGWQTWREAGIAPWMPALLLLGFAALYLPTYADLARRVWPGDEQGHGPIILAVSLWLMFDRRRALAALRPRPQAAAGLGLLLAGVVLFVLGRTQSIMVFEVGSQILVLLALVLGLGGRPAVRLLAFPLFFMLFMVPLPASVVATITGPLKTAVTAVASQLLYTMGYPVARAGVLLTVGPYQLLVADACAGLNSMFTLEALGLLYLNLVRSRSALRNVALAVLVIPIAFVANVVRVVILVLVTFHFGDEAGQGFVHRLAGLVLFFVGLTLMLGTDGLLRRLTAGPPPTRGAGA